MTDLRARLVIALRTHHLSREDRRAWWCTCGADCLTVGGSYHKHVADALLSLDGIAIVEELPEPLVDVPDVVAEDRAAFAHARIDALQRAVTRQLSELWKQLHRQATGSSPSHVQTQDCYNSIWGSLYEADREVRQQFGRQDAKERREAL